MTAGSPASLIETEDSAFSQFDPYPRSSGFSTTAPPSDPDNEPDDSSMGKGKAVSKPICIPSHEITSYDIFDMDSLELAHMSTLSSHTMSPASVASTSGSSYFTGKGKGREIAPTLPPLSFTRDDFHWSRSPDLAGPSTSSYTSGLESLPTVALSSPVRPEIDSHHLPSNLPVLHPVPSRRKSLSNISIQSVQPRALSLSKVKFSGSTVHTSNLARRIMLSKRDDLEERSQNKANTQSGINPVQSFAALDLVDAHHQLPLHYNARAVFGKSRSYSSPLPFSALDIISAPHLDTFTPIPILVRNYFDEALPREIQLHIFSCIVEIAVHEHAQVVLNGHWSVAKSSAHKNKWVGRDAGLRTLVIISRVSKLWQSLAFDGQLWSNLDLRSFSQVPPTFLSRIAKTGGAFIRSMNLPGNTRLLPESLVDTTKNLCMTPSSTQLTSINLNGCSLLTSKSIHHLLMRAPALEKLNLKGLSAVTNTTFDILLHCQLLRYLNVSRCQNMDSKGVKSLAVAALTRGQHLQLRELHLCGLKHISDSMMAALGRAAPYLEVLDLSYARQLHNSAVEAFVSVDDSWSSKDLGVETVMLTARQVGREPSSESKYRRRVTRLRHLSLSCCILLSDNVCSNLAHSVPQLESLELAGIGKALQDDGLIRLLETTPLIRRLDLEDAPDITDALLHALTPSGLNSNSGPTCRPPETGLSLEHLIISYADRITDAAILSLIHGCRLLSKLEVDNTRVSGTTVKEFIRTRHAENLRNSLSKIVAVDCRAIGEQAVKSVGDMTRPRVGWSSYQARALGFLDGRDVTPESGLYADLRKAGLIKSGGLQDECDERRVVLKTFYGWQSVDAIAAIREKRRKTLKRDQDGSGNARGRWWSPGASSSRRSGTGSPAILDLNDRDACIIA